jgi:molecular chaperone DnaJ
MADKRDFYEILGVTRTATHVEISEAYRKAAIKNHPDKNPGDEEAVKRFKEAAEAFEVLNDAEKRARYDKFGHAGMGGQAGGRHFSDIEDIFEAFGDFFGGGGAFGEMFGNRGGGGGRRRPRKGDDLRVDVTIDLIEAARGCKKTIRFERSRKCDDCNGSGAKAGSAPQQCSYCGGRGQVVQQAGILRVQTTCPACRGAGSVVKDPCKGCKGQGYVAEQVVREVAIPGGVDTGMRIRVPGEGQPSPSGGPAGDCYCFLTVREHPLFQREGAHLICRIPISYTQACLGAEIEVPTLDGRREVKIPSGTQPGDILTLRGCGLPDPHGGRRVGDLHVQLDLEVPKSLTPKQEKLLRDLAEVEHTNVSPHRKNFLERLKDYLLPRDDVRRDEAEQEKAS